jgi:N-acetylmuramoyl-L-alanine amidase
MQKIFTCIIRNVNSTYLFIVFFICVQSKQLFGQQAALDLNKIRTVIIDAGHGGKDSGALGENSMEKDLASV